MKSALLAFPAWLVAAAGVTAGADAAQVAADKDGAIGQQLMTAAGVTGIPCALVVDSQGIVRFCGHPADPAFEAAIQQVHPSCSKVCPPMSPSRR